MAEKFNLWSTYHYATNNPVNIIDYDGRDTVPSNSRVHPIAPVPYTTTAPTSTSSGGGSAFLSSIGQRILGVIGFVLMPVNNNQSYYQGIPIENFERFVTDPKSLDDDYLAGVRKRIESGSASQQDYFYAKEAYSRSGAINDNILIYKPTFKHGPGGFGTYMDLNDMTAQIVLNSSVPGGKDRYGYFGGKVYQFYPDNVGRYHGYPVLGSKVDGSVLKALRDSGHFNNKIYQKLIGQKSF